MRDYIIMTDSCCDLTDHMAKELELTVVPLTVHIDGQDYPNLLDGSAISFEDFYSKIRAGKLATTSAANVGQFQDAMRPVLDTLHAWAGEYGFALLDYEWGGSCIENDDTQFFDGFHLDEKYGLPDWTRQLFTELRGNDHANA